MMFVAAFVRPVYEKHARVERLKIVIDRRRVTAALGRNAPVMGKEILCPTTSDSYRVRFRDSRSSHSYAGYHGRIFGQNTRSLRLRLFVSSGSSDEVHHNMRVRVLDENNNISYKQVHPLRTTIIAARIM